MAEHVAGEKVFVDYSGKQPSIVDPKTGEVIAVELFVAVLGASNFTYAEATLTQQVAERETPDRPEACPHAPTIRARTDE